MIIDLELVLSAVFYYYCQSDTDWLKNAKYLDL